MFKPRKRATHSRLAKQRRKMFFVNTIAVVVIALIFFVTFAFVLGLEEITITQTVIEGNAVVASMQLQAFVNRKLEGKYMRLFPKKSIFIYPRKHIEAAVLESFPKIDTADVSFADFQSIRLSVTERVPFALWCLPAEQTGDKQKESEACYFLDRDGFLYTEAPSFSGDTFFRYYGLHSVPDGAGTLVGLRFLSEDTFHELAFFIAALRDGALSPVALRVLDDTDMEIMLKKNEKIIVAREKNISRTLANIQSFFDSEAYRENKGNLDYADFRFGNKVYYQFK